MFPDHCYGNGSIMTVPDDEENYADDESSYNSNEEGEDGAVEENEELE